MGEGNGTPLSRSLAAPPPSAASFFSSAGSLDQALLESFSEGRGGGGHYRIGAQHVQPAGNGTPREAGEPLRIRTAKR